MSEKQINGLLTVTLMVALVFSLAAGCVSGFCISGSKPKVDVDWSTSWAMNGGESLSLPQRLANRKGDCLMITKTLPRKLEKDSVLVVDSSYLPVEAALDGEPLAVSGTFIEGIFGITYANSRSVISLPDSAAGRRMELTLHLNGSKHQSEIYEILLGSKALIRAHYDQGGEAINLAGGFLLCLAIVMLALRQTKGRRYRAEVLRRLWRTELYLWLAAVWLLTDCGANVIRYGANGAYLFINLFSFSFMIVPISLLVRSVSHTGRRMLGALAFLLIGFNATVLVLLCFGIFQLAVTLSLLHVLQLMVIVLTMSSLIWDCFVKKDRSEFGLLAGFFAVATTGLATMYSFYYRCVPDNTSVFRVGIVIHALIFTLMAVSHAVTSSAEEQSVQKVEFAATHDPLTGIYNKYAFYQNTRALMASNRTATYAVGSFDVERFCLINDIFGREQGDRLLCYIAGVLERLVAADGTFGRLESDKFLLCTPNSGDRIEHIIHEIQAKMAAYPLDFAITVSFGWFAAEDRTLTPEVMVDRASLARETVKGSYLERSAFYNEAMLRSMLLAQDVVNQFESALAGEQFFLMLQPKYQLHDGAVYGAEALVHWRNPERGVITPGEFIPILEKNGLIMRLDEYVWEHACMLLRTWMDEFSENETMPISVNVSRVNLYNPNLVAVLVGITKRFCVPPRLLPLEITESAYSDNPMALIDLTNNLHACGFSVHMDDFGSGYSSLNMLKDVDVDAIKLDMRFLYGAEKNHRSEGIIKAVVGMAREIGVRVVAEGVETDEQVNLLKDAGCVAAQGYYYSRSITVEQMTELLRVAQHRKTEQSAAV